MSNDTFGSSDVPTSLTPTINSQVRGSGGGFFYDNTTIYTFSGFDKDDVPATNVLPTFNTSTDTWATVAVDGGNFSYGQLGGMVTSSVPEFSLSFSLSGDLANVAEGLIRLDTSIPNKPSWANITMDAFQNPTPRVAGASMPYVPMGKRGVLMLIGGFDVRRCRLLQGDGLRSC